jgi:hypothetical protein
MGIDPINDSTVSFLERNGFDFSLEKYPTVAHYNDIGSLMAIVQLTSKSSVVTEMFELGTLTDASGEVFPDTLICVFAPDDNHAQLYERIERAIYKYVEDTMTDSEKWLYELTLKNILKEIKQKLKV